MPDDALKLSKHFCERYAERIGCPPDLDGVKGIIDGAVVVQKGKNFRLKDGRIFNTLSIYWNPRVQIIVTVDERKSTAVSVFASKVLNDPKRERMLP